MIKTIEEIESPEDIDALFSESQIVGRSMVTFGGSFVNNLGKALLCADLVNTKKIKQTWPEYWNQYLKMSDRL